MIKKLQVKLVVLSMSALLLTMILIIGGINIVNYRGILGEADTLLAYLAENKGNFPMNPAGKAHALPMEMSPEIPYESRYFSVMLNLESGAVIQVQTGRIASVDTQSAIAYALEVWNKTEKKGFLDAFRYLVSEEEDTVEIIFLDCGRKMDSFRKFLGASVGISIAGYLVVLFLVTIFSNRIIRPISESYEKQKQFVTDAGHEIKTPLTIINADIDVLEMDMGENEWLEDIKKQTKRLMALTKDLVYLARMEESGDSLQMIEFPFSDVVSETVISFQAVAQQQDKQIVSQIQPMLSLKGDEKAIQHLISIFLDNALKYSPDKATISVVLEKQKKFLVLTVSNPTDYPVPREKLPMLFERFYRLDASRNSQTGGHGIGLSVAKAIVAAHNGRIQAQTKDEKSLEIVVSLPA